MGYVGNQITNAYTSIAKQDLTGVTGSPVKRGFTLDYAVANANEIEVFVNNVRQEPSVAYTVSGTALTMTGSVAASDDFYVVFQGKAVGTVVPPDDSVTTARIVDGAVTNAKIDTVAATKLTGTVDTSNLPSGTVVAMRHYSNSTRTAMSQTTPNGTIWSFTDTKVGGTNTDIIVQVNIIGKDDAAGTVGTYIEYDGTKSYSTAYTYEATAYNKLLTGSMKATGKTSGSKTVKIGWDVASGVNSYPFVILNPNSIDDNRNYQHVSTAIVYEVVT